MLFPTLPHASTKTTAGTLVPFSELDVDVMHHIRLAIDPQEISNRGKMFPGGDAPVMKLRGLHPLEKAGIISRE